MKRNYYLVIINHQNLKMILNIRNDKLREEVLTREALLNDFKHVQLRIVGGTLSCMYGTCVPFN